MPGCVVMEVPRGRSTWKSILDPDTPPSKVEKADNYKSTVGRSIK